MSAPSRPVFHSRSAPGRITILRSWCPGDFRAGAGPSRGGGRQTARAQCPPHPAAPQEAASSSIHLHRRPARPDATTLIRHWLPNGQGLRSPRKQVPAVPSAPAGELPKRYLPINSSPQLSGGLVQHTDQIAAARDLSLFVAHLRRHLRYIGNFHRAPVSGLHRGPAACRSPGIASAHHYRTVRQTPATPLARSALVRAAAPTAPHTPDNSDDDTSDTASGLRARPDTAAHAPRALQFDIAESTARRDARAATASFPAHTAHIVARISPAASLSFSPLPGVIHVRPCASLPVYYPLTRSAFVQQCIGPLTQYWVIARCGLLWDVAVAVVWIVNPRGRMRVQRQGVSQCLMSPTTSWFRCSVS